MEPIFWEESVVQAEGDVPGLKTRTTATWIPELGLLVVDCAAYLCDTRPNSMMVPPFERGKWQLPPESPSAPARMAISVRHRCEAVRETVRLADLWLYERSAAYQQLVGAASLPAPTRTDPR